MPTHPHLHPRPHRYSPHFILEAVELAHKLGKGGGNRAAKQLNITRTTLYRWMRAVKRLAQSPADWLAECETEEERQKRQREWEVIVEARRWSAQTGRSMYACILAAAKQRGVDGLQIARQLALGQYPGMAGSGFAGLS
jgi:hypothetical protein